MLVHEETERLKEEVAPLQLQGMLTQEDTITAVHQRVQVQDVQTIGQMEVEARSQEVHHRITFQEVLQALHIHHHRQVHLRVALRQVAVAVVDQDNSVSNY